MRRPVRLVALAVTLLAGLALAVPASAAADAPRQIVVSGDATVLQYGPQLTLALRARVTDDYFRPVAGKDVDFRLMGAFPTPATAGGGILLCRAVTDADGNAACPDVNAAVGAVLSVLAGKAFAISPATDEYAFGWDTLWAINMCPDGPVRCRGPVL